MNVNLPLELFYQIISELNLDNILELCQSHREFNFLCRDEYLWYILFKRDYPYIYSDYEHPLLNSWKNTMLNKSLRYLLEHPLTEYLWEITQPPSQSLTSESNPQVDYIFKGPLTLLIPISRYSYGYLDEITINQFFIPKEQILQIIYQYYQQPLTLEQLDNYLKRDQEEFNKKYPDTKYLPDSFLIQAIDAIKRGIIVKHYELMSNFLYFEGLTPIDDNKFKISLGS